MDKSFEDLWENFTSHEHHGDSLVVKQLTDRLNPIQLLSSKPLCNHNIAVEEQLNLLVIHFNYSILNNDYKNKNWYF